MLAGAAMAGVVRGLERPMRRMTQALSALAAGDLHAPIPDAGQRGEVGRMAAALQVLKDGAQVAEARADELRRTNTRFDAALAHMSVGLCMYGPDERLAVVNARYAEIFGLPPERVRIGSTRMEAIQLRAEHGHHGGVPAEEVFQRSGGMLERRQPGVWEMAAAGGRTVEVYHTPMPDGGWVATFEDVTERRRAEAKAAFLARHDALTGLANRMLFQDRLREALASPARGGSEEHSQAADAEPAAAVLCLDLDRFKEVNDTLGHPVGDLLLRAAAERLASAVRATGTVARLGGDEFAVLQPGLAGPAEAEELAACIVALLRQPFNLDGREVVAGASIGIALAPRDGADFDTLLRNADLALYQAKADGRDRWRMFTPALDARRLARRTLAGDLRRALADGEGLDLAFQPLMDLRTGRPCGFEALARWHHPAHGQVSPAAFIPIAEETGLILPLGEWALRRACAAAAGWPNGLRVAVNLSAVQFRGQDLVSCVAGALDAAGLPAARLELEVTESALLAADGVRDVLRQLRALGVSIAMDDFGTGYSSLSYFRDFPFDRVKIDRGFIRDIAGVHGAAPGGLAVTERMEAGPPVDKPPPNGLAIVRAVLAIAGALNVRTLAEGVETAAQLAQLQAEGCQEAQGFLFSPPMPGAEVMEWLRCQAWRPASPSPQPSQPVLAHALGC